MVKKIYLLLILTALILSGCKLIPSQEKNKTGPVQEVPTDGMEQESTVADEATEISEGNMTLDVISPKNQSTVTSPSLVVLGQTQPKAEVTVNENELIAGSNGAFSQKITLEEGENYIIVTASDEDGNYVEKEIAVIYEPEE